MKKIFTLLLLVPLKCFSCDIISNTEYSFDYKYQDGKLTYTIKNKSNVPFFILQIRGKRTNIMNGFFFEDKQKIEKNNGGISILSSIDDAKYLREYLMENDQLYSSALTSEKISQSYHYPFSKFNDEIQGRQMEDSLLVKEKLLTDNINLTEWLKDFKDFYPENKKYGDQKIIFQVKIPQDERAKTCLIFQTKPITVHFPNKFEAKIQEWKEQIFGKPTMDYLKNKN